MPYDTGASDVSLSMVEATFMMKNGYLSQDDVVGSSYFMDANGNVSEGTMLVLRKVTFGDDVLTNVHASVVRNQRAPLLLGQSVLARLGKVEIDNQKRIIKISRQGTVSVLR
ncbi:MAG: retropepsin-like aspartic protease [Prevotellaceae bacterium]|nr:retropepsin-like aspartic protease [Prevotellaceae bacterium]